MGGKSKSTQATTNQQSTNNIVNDGEFAGAGDVSVDESQHIVEDSYNTDNSVSLADSFNTDKSRDYDDSFNTDNSIENDGDYAGNHGTITLSDSGAIDAAKDIAGKALSVNESSLKSAYKFGGDALDEMQTIASSALDSMEAVNDDALDFGTRALDSVTEQSSNYSDNVKDMLSTSQRTNQTVLANAAKSNTDDKAIIADLARSTSLAGQDIVAKSSERMTLYMAVALGFGFVAMVLFGREG